MYKNILPLIGIVLLCSSLAIAQENKWSSKRPDGHAPISIMGDHYHKKGEFMFSYKYMPMKMIGNIETVDDISNDEIYQNFVVAPQNMSVNMHMLGIMYAPSDNITLMAMGNYIINDMSLRTKMGVDFVTESNGIGDINLSCIIKMMNKKRQSIHCNIGMSIPTGNIDQRDETPMMNDAKLAYPMQLGSGTWDPSISLTYLGQSDNISWGIQSTYKVRLDENSNSYNFGSIFNIVGWAAIKLSDNFSYSTSLSNFKTQKNNGLDADLNPMVAPLSNTENSGRNQINVGLGLNFLVPKGDFKNLRLASEIRIPVVQKVNGIQMKNTIMSTFGVQYSFGH
jgi:hypothetical protein